MPFAIGAHQVSGWVLLACGAFGALWGSFLNVVIVRLPRGESIVFPASHCVVCGAPIRAYDNIPVLSYLILRGRCRHCGASYSARYPIIELIAGLLAAACVNEFGLSLVALVFFVFVALLLAIAAIDLEHWIIPHELSWPGIALGLLFSPFNPNTKPLGAALAALVAFVLFTLLAWLGRILLKKEALGLGDRWLLAMEGAFLGPVALLPVVFLASVQGSIVGLALLALGRAQRGPMPEKAPVAPPPAESAAADIASAAPVDPAPETPSVVEALPAVPIGPPGEETAAPAAEDEDEDWVPPRNAIPFGPFLALAGAEWLFVGPALLDWYHHQLMRLLF